MNNFVLYDTGIQKRIEFLKDRWRTSADRLRDILVHAGFVHYLNRDITAIDILVKIFMLHIESTNVRFYQYFIKINT